MWHLRKDTIERWCWCQPLTKEGCDNIIKLGNKLELKESAVGDGDGKLINQARKSKTCFLPINDETRWIYETCSKMVIDMNKQFFEYDLDYISNLQFTVYHGDSNDFYEKHIDTAYESAGIRKISFSIQLSDPETYEGGDLLLYYEKDPVKCKREQGAMTLFPSFSLHEVTPVTKGTRYSLVGWVVGPKLK
jgi:PKHD-type hydroxylase